MSEEYELPISALEGGFTGLIIGVIIGLSAVGLFPEYFGLVEPIPTQYNVVIAIICGIAGILAGAIGAIAFGGEPKKKGKGNYKAQVHDSEIDNGGK